MKESSVEKIKAMGNKWGIIFYFINGSSWPQKL